MAKPRKTLTSEQVSQVEGLASVLTVEQMADYFGMGRSTFFELMKRNKAVSGLYKKGRAKTIGAVAQNLIQKARNGDTASQIFFLKTQAGWKEPEKEMSDVGALAEQLKELAERRATT